MKIFVIALVLIFVGLIGVYVTIGRLGGGEQLQQDKILAAELQGREALNQKRPDLALIYFDKGLKALGEAPLKPQRAKLQAGRGEALKALKRCPEASQAWAEACRLGNTPACQAPACP